MVAVHLLAFLYQMGFVHNYQSSHNNKSRRLSDGPIEGINNSIEKNT